MKLLKTAVVALALTGAAAAAQAQQPQGNNNQHQKAPPHGQAPAHGQGAGPQGGQHNAVAPQGGQHNFVAPQGGQFNGQRGGAGFNGQANGQVQRFNGQRGAPGFNGQANGQVQRFNGQRGAPGGVQAGVRAGFGFQNHAPRARDQGRASYSARVFAPQFQAQRRFRFGGYRSWPSGWYLRSWNYGDFLPWGWFGSQFYIDWGDYGLPPPPIGCEWIAQGPDAVLVDIWTGEVLSVYRGVFYWNGY